MFIHAVMGSGKGLLTSRLELVDGLFYSESCLCYQFPPVPQQCPFTPLQSVQGKILLAKRQDFRITCVRDRRDRPYRVVGLNGAVGGS
jgi:hypothetical protein